MSHDEDGGAIIILSISLPAECETPLDNMVANGAYGSTREEVACHYICRALGVDPHAAPPAPQVPEHAVPAAEAATGGEGGAPD